MEEIHPFLMDSLGCWNTRGLNRTNKQREVQLFLHKSKVSLFDLLETKIKRDKANKVALILCEGWSFTINLNSHSGGRIWMLWKLQMFKVQIIQVTEQLIHGVGQNKRTGVEFSLMMVYGFNYHGMRRKLWKDLEAIHGYIKGSWIFLGYFHCVLNK